MKKKYLIIILLLLLTGCKDKTYTVTFIDNEELLGILEIEEGSTIEEIDTPNKEGYIFVSWLKDGIEYDLSNPIEEDITLTANWILEPVIAKTYTAIFNFGDYTKTQSVKEGETATKPTDDPEKEKHKFLGWYIGDTLYDFDTPVEKDLVITAKYEKTRVMIKFELDGGSGTIQKEINKGETLEIPITPTKFGYNFVSWTLNGKVFDFNTPINEDITIKATWEAITYHKITFDTSGGEVINSQMIPSGTNIQELPTPIKEGYTFKCWSLEDNEFDINTKITKDITLIAIYEE